MRSATPSLREGFVNGKGCARLDHNALENQLTEFSDHRPLVVPSRCVANLVDPNAQGGGLKRYLGNVEVVGLTP